VIHKRIFNLAIPASLLRGYRFPLPLRERIKVRGRVKRVLRQFSPHPNLPPPGGKELTYNDKPIKGEEEQHNIPVKGLLTLLSIGLVLLLNGCGPSYPGDKITDAVKRVVKKEYKLESTAKLSGDTLYLDVQLAGLNSTETKALSGVFKKVQGAVLIITRVCLSSDAKIRYMVVTARDPSWKLGMRIIQRLDDVKALLYQKISHADYEERLVLEINGDVGSKDAGSAENPKMIDVREFVGRLVVSQINMLGRTNPFLSVILGNSRLEFLNYTDEELVVKLGSSLSPQALPLFESIIANQSKKTITKFSLLQPKRIKVLGENNQAFSIILRH